MKDIETLINSIYKNIQELSKFLFYDLGIKNYYELVEYLEKASTIFELKNKNKIYLDKGAKNNDN